METVEITFWGYLCFAGVIFFIILTFVKGQEYYGEPEFVDFRRIRDEITIFEFEVKAIYRPTKWGELMGRKEEIIVYAGSGLFWYNVNDWKEASNKVCL